MISYDIEHDYVHIVYILAASPLASSGFAAIGCLRASPYGGIYILKKYSKLTAKNLRFFLPSPDQNSVRVKKKYIQIAPSVPEEIGFKHT